MNLDNAQIQEYPVVLRAHPAVMMILESVAEESGVTASDIATGLIHEYLQANGYIEMEGVEHA